MRRKMGIVQATRKRVSAMESHWERMEWEKIVFSALNNERRLCLWSKEETFCVYFPSVLLLRPKEVKMVEVWDPRMEGGGWNLVL